MVGIRNVISTLTADGREVMGPNVLLFHHPESAIVSGSLLTVESNHFCVLKARGAVLNVYETGQYPVITPDKPLIGLVFDPGVLPGARASGAIRGAVHQQNEDGGEGPRHGALGRDGGDVL